MRTFVGVIADAVHFCLLRPLYTRDEWEIRRAVWEGRWIDANRVGRV